MNEEIASNHLPSSRRRCQLTPLAALMVGPRIRSLLLVLLMAMLVIACPVRGGRLDEVAVRTWDTVQQADSFPPELNDAALAVPWLRDRPSFGIAFSGGGTRSATATLGQLRALQALGWLQRSRYISANSGGTWTTVPYTYLPARFDEQRFLGAYVPPEEITEDTLKPEGPQG